MGTSTFWNKRVRPILDIVQAFGVVCAAIGLIYTGIQIRENSNVASAEMGLRFDDRFLQPDMMKIQDAVESYPADPILIEHHGQSTDDQLEQYLGYYDTLYYMYEQNLVNDKMMEDLFCGDIEDAYRDPEVTEHLKQYRSIPRSATDVMGFDKLAAICISWDKSGRSKLLEE